MEKHKQLDLYASPFQFIPAACLHNLVKRGKEFALGHNFSKRALTHTEIGMINGC